MYSAVLCEHKVSPLTSVGYYGDQDLEQSADPDWGT
mgnify:CR=1 FL=1